MQASLVVDLKKNRIRIHKGTLHLLGNPQYIQFLVNPNKSVIALLPSQEQDYLAHKIHWKTMGDHQCCEIYSKPLIRSIHNITDKLELQQIYRIDGEFLKDKNLILFSIEESTLLP